jgi:serine/threonine-protein kinase
MIGTTISHYRITEEIGRGGMGVVYKAEDTKLDRTVALKFLPPQALITEDDRARFYREARAAAALHHPNIATVFEIDEVTLSTDSGIPTSGGISSGMAPGARPTTPLIAMEYIEGETLAESVSRGPLPLEDAISIASQIADGLNAAHEKDIVHRDVKCGNVMITKKGVAKILDFGLAKTTASTRLTQMGSTLGTAAYMSPEQARGEEVDDRSDIWSLGVILYEMVTGRMPFPGDYEQAVVYGILNAAPEPLTALRTGVPMELERIVEKCLDKDARKRYGHAAEIKVDLERIDLMSATRARTGAIPVAYPVAGAPSSKKVYWAAGGLIAGILATAIAFQLLRPAGTPAVSRAASPVHRLSLNLPPNAPLTPVGAANLGVGLTALRLSSDGRNLVYVADVDGVPKLAVRSMDREEVRILEGTDRAYHPFLSPDGSWVAFFVDGQLKKVSIDGGSPVLLSAVSDPMGGFWTNDDRIIMMTGQGAVLRVIGAGGGEPIVEKSGIGWSQPTLLPGGKTLLANSRSRGILALSLETLEGSVLVERGRDPRYVESGHIVFARPGRLMAVPFDVTSLAVTGAPAPVADNVRTESVVGFAHYTVSANGTLVYVPGGAVDVGRLTWVDRDGRAADLGFEPDLFGTFRISPDGSRIAAIVEGATASVWIYDLTRKSRTRFAEGRGTPVWTLDGQSIVHPQPGATEGTYAIMQRPANGGPATTLLETTSFANPFSWSPDGSLLAYYSDYELWLLPFEDGTPGTPRKWLESTDEEWSPAISTDGRFVAYTLIGEGNSEVFVGPIEGGDVRWQVSANGGEEPVWSPRGDELFYSNGRTWYSVTVKTSPEFEAGVPRVLFEGNYLNVPGQGYDVHPDGSKFLVVESSESDAPVGELKVVENWFEELERLAPTGRIR